MERKFKFSVDEYYHIYSRGVERREIFLDKNDKERFLRSLYVFNSDKSFQIRETSEIPYGQLERGEERTALGAYCFMPNHFHLLVRETTPGGISAFMGKLLTAYSMYFNKKYKRTGALFESTFRARHVDNDNYLKYLFSYIHLNPIKLIEPEWKQTGVTDKKVAEEFLRNYRYSSYHDYMGTEREERSILNQATFPEYFESGQSFNNFIKDWIEYADFKE